MPQRSARSGTQIEVLDRPIEFCFWPVARGERRNKLQSRLFATNPWSVLNQLSEEIPLSHREGAKFYLRQAEALYEAANESPSVEAKPLLSYYAILNTAKFGCIKKAIERNFSDSAHGLATPTTPNGRGLSGATLTFWESRHNQNSKVNVFDTFNQSVDGHPIPHRSQIAIDQVARQILVGHRLWAEGLDQKEKFLNIDRIDLLHDKATNIAWCNIILQKKDVKRLGVGYRKILENSNLSSDFRIVKSKDDAEICFEQTTPTRYTGRPADILNALTGTLRKRVWQSATTIPPFRKYYLYISDSDNITFNQLSSIYVMFYYLSSMTRYYPDEFNRLIEGSLSAFIREFMENQLAQWIYLYTSQLKKQDVVRAAIVNR